MALAVIPPNSESVIPAKLDSEFPLGRFGIIEPSQHLMERYQLWPRPLPAILSHFA